MLAETSVKWAIKDHVRKAFKNQPYPVHNAQLWGNPALQIWFQRSDRKNEEKFIKGLLAKPYFYKAMPSAASSSNPFIQQKICCYRSSLLSSHFFSSPKIESFRWCDARWLKNNPDANWKWFSGKRTWVWSQKWCGAIQCFAVLCDVVQCYAIVCCTMVPC